MSSSLTPHEVCVLKALDKQAFKPSIASAHAIRQYLTALGLDKREAVEAMASLVNKNLLERVKVVDNEGLFYMAYRHKNKA